MQARKAFRQIRLVSEGYCLVQTVSTYHPPSRPCLPSCHSLPAGLFQDAIVDSRMSSFKNFKKGGNTAVCVCANRLVCVCVCVCVLHARMHRSNMPLGYRLENSRRSSFVCVPPASV